MRWGPNLRLGDLAEGCMVSLLLYQYPNMYATKPSVRVATDDAEDTGHPGRGERMTARPVAWNVAVFVCNYWLTEVRK